MKTFQSYLVVALLLGVSSAKDGDPLPAKSYHVSCNFQKDLCEWKNNPSSLQRFIIASNKPHIMNPPNGCSYLLQEGNSKPGMSQAILDSPEFTTLPSMIALQINISFWMINNNHTANLTLDLIHLQEGTSNGSEMAIWTTTDGLPSSHLWNMTTIYFNKLQGTQKLKLTLRGSIGAPGDLIAISEITVTEKATNGMPDVGILPESSYTFTNHSTCANGASHLHFNIIYAWLVILGIFYVII